MRLDKKLKKKIQKEFENTRIPFEQWAEQHNIALDKTEKKSDASPQNGMPPILQPGKSGTALARNSILISAFCLLTVVAMIIVAVVVANLTPSNNPPLYGVDDVNSIHITLDELVAVEDVYLFDTTKLINEGQISKDVLIDDREFILCYNIKDGVFLFEDGLETYAFHISYKILVYENYEFLYYETFENLQNILEIGDKKISYAINEDSRYVMGHARFKVNDYEYFLETSGFDGVTELSDNNFIILLQYLFP